MRCGKGTHTLTHLWQLLRDSNPQFEQSEIYVFRSDLPSLPPFLPLYKMIDIWDGNLFCWNMLPTVLQGLGISLGNI